MSKNKSILSKNNIIESSDVFNIPLIGLVQAKDDADYPGDYYLGELVSNFPDHSNIQVTLQALDNAMSQSGILKGDFINIDKDVKLKDNDIVVVKLGERIYIRKYFSERSLIRLETSNEISSPLVIDPKTPGFKLIGKVISITRQL